MPDTFEIRRAERKRARLRLAVCAASNGGKTWTGLLLAFGLVEELIARGELSGTAEGKVGVIDTERASADLYAHLGPFDTLQLTAPYSVDRYIAAITQLERAGYAVILLDSISHAWQGAGGVLALLSTFQNSEKFSAFNTAINPEQDRLVDAMLRSPCHVIATMRSKTAWVLEDVERNGRTVKAPRRVGLAPIQRPGIEYEFTTLLDLDTKTHFAEVVKNRCPVFHDWQPKRITTEHGRALAAWLLEGAPAPEVPLSGTAEDRAEATAVMAVRAIERCQNLPDVARVYDKALGQLKGFVGSVDNAKLVAMRARVVEAKDVHKTALGTSLAAKPIDTTVGDRPATAPATRGILEAAISTDQESDIRERLRDRDVKIGALLAQFGVSRLAEVRAGSYDDCLQWIDQEAATAQGGLRGAGALAGANHFADLEDDLPF
jgi:hypothetical protein